MPTRRFDDTLPPLEPLDHITDSDWSKLSESERADLLRAREALMLARHNQLIDSQNAIRERVSQQGLAIKAQTAATQRIGRRLDDDLGPLLTENTAATARTEAKVDDLLKQTESLLLAWTNTQGFGRVVRGVGGWIKDVAWVAVPLGALVAGWRAFVAWMKAGFPGPGP